MKQTLLYCIVFLIITRGCMVAKKITVNDWKIAATVPAPAGSDKQHGLAGPVTGVANNVLIVAGGANFPGAMPWLGGSKKYYDDVYVFAKDDNHSINVIDKKMKLPYPLAYAASVSTPQGVVCAGGENEHGVVQKVMLIKWYSPGEQVVYKELPDLPVAVTNASIAVHDNTVYFAGGETVSNVSNQFLSLDLTNTASGWKELPDVPFPVSNAVMVTQNSAGGPGIYLIGGRKKNAGSTSSLYSSVYAFSLKDKKWAEKASLPYPLSAGTGLALSENRIFLFGGDKGATFNKTEELIASINTEKDEGRKQQLIEQKTALQSSHPGFSSDILVYNTLTNNWEIVGAIPFEGQVTTTAVKWGEQIIIPSGEIRAGVRTPHIISGSMLDK